MYLRRYIYVNTKHDINAFKLRHKSRICYYIVYCNYDHIFYLMTMFLKYLHRLNDAWTNVPVKYSIYSIIFVF